MRMAVVINRDAIANASEYERQLELERCRRYKRILEQTGEWHVSTVRYPDLATINELIAILEAPPCST